MRYGMGTRLGVGKFPQMRPSTMNTRHNISEVNQKPDQRDNDFNQANKTTTFQVCRLGYRCHI